MPALDRCHPQVVRALEMAGWVVGPKPVSIGTVMNTLFADLEAERRVGDNIERIILVEVKCFADSDTMMNDVYTALGQYLIYRSLIRQLYPSRAIYLAIPNFAYHGVFTKIAMPVVKEAAIKLLVIDLVDEVIEQWLE
jgi:hypothetical protein